jgi:hypothetical protein
MSDIQKATKPTRRLSSALAQTHTQIRVDRRSKLHSVQVMGEQPTTDFLCASGSGLIGAGSIFNLAGSYFEFNSSPSDEASDARAIGCDWAMVGQDLRDALDRAAQSGGSKA